METNQIWNHENSECWKKARDLTIKIHRLSTHINSESDRSLQKALRKSSLSIMTQITLGNEHDNPQESIKYLGYAKASLAAFRTYLIILREFGYLSEADYLDFEDRIIHIAVLLGRLIQFKSPKK